MLIEILLFLAGLAMLVYGASRAVAEASNLALYYGVSPFFIGVTVISIGTSVPEMVTSIVGARLGAGDIVVGNIVGSEIAQITLAIGIVALIAPIVATRREVLVYGGGMVLAMVIMILAVDDGQLTFSEGVLMMLAYVEFIYILYSNVGGAEIAEETVERQTPRQTVPWILAGLVLVVVGGQVMVTNAVELARLVGISEYLIGLLTGLGTTVPEITVAGIAAYRGDGGISVGALLGSNITDPVFSLGVGALVATVRVDTVGISTSLTYMLVVSILVLALMYWRRGLGRREAIVCLLLYPASLLLS
ncbi:sodium:calcium antiporter [Haladaptatus sp. GCM10025707]|uniref:sodium:calcium antiporter n=1 Tax=unclassified Haladaptatus TaxID=2622732 RepID=UPI0023E8BD08|nr:MULTISPECIES: sodium:calcium antiporter [unclassified Haladaptatus]